MAYNVEYKHAVLTFVAACKRAQGAQKWPYVQSKVVKYDISSAEMIVGGGFSGAV